MLYAGISTNTPPPLFPLVIRQGHLLKEEIVTNACLLSINDNVYDPVFQSLLHIKKI